MKVMLFPGTFDPFTRGHRDIARRASKLCDELVVAVMENSAKTPLFTIEEREDLIRKSLTGEELDRFCLNSMMEKKKKKLEDALEAL